MATLSYTPRRTKDNPWPRAQAPLARWSAVGSLIPRAKYALRADGAVVRRLPIEGSGWSVVKLVGLPKKGLTIEQVASVLEPLGYAREQN